MPASAPEGYPAETRVTRPRSTVTVDGLPGRPAGWSVRREIVTDLPDQVRGISGMSIASAGIEWLPDEPIVPPGHWSPFGDRKAVRHDVDREVTITVGRDDTRVGMFAGRVAEATASTDHQRLSLDCDEIPDALKRPAVLQPLAERMPVTDGTSTVTCGITPSWALHRVLANVGYHSVPPAQPGVMLDVPLQGSLWPRLGRLVAGSTDTDTSRWPGQYYRTKVHRAVDGTETVVPDSYITAWSGASSAIGTWDATGEPGSSSDPVRVGMFYSGTGTSTVTLVGALEADASATDPVYTTKITVTASTITVRRERADGTFDQQSTPWVGRGPLEIWIAKLIGAGSTANRAWWDGGSWSTALTNLVPAGIPSRVTWSPGTGNYAAGLQVGMRSGALPWGYVDHVPTADLDGTLGTIYATPGIDGEQTVWDVVQDIARAELGAFWTDEDGRAKYRNRSSLRGVGMPARPVTTSQDITGMSWTEREEATVGYVEVPYQPVLIRTSPAGLTDITVWQLDHSVRVEARNRWVTRVWAKLDAIAIGLDLAMKGNHFGVGTGSGYRAVSRTDGQSRFIGARARQTSPRGVLLEFYTWSFTTSIYDLLDPNGDPWAVLRARMSITQDSSGSSESIARVRADRSRDDVYTLPTSPWRQAVGDSNELADWLAGDMREPQPVLTTVSIVPDPLIRLADKVEITGLGGARMVGVVAGYTYAEDAEGLVTQDLTVRPLPITFADVDDVWSGQTFADFDAHWAGSTFADFDDNPEEHP